MTITWRILWCSPPRCHSHMDDQIQRIQAILQSMEESARPVFDDKDIQELRNLVRLTVEFHDFLTSTPPWPAFPDDPFHNMTYTVDKVLFNVDSFQTVM